MRPGRSFLFFGSALSALCGFFRLGNAMLTENCDWHPDEHRPSLDIFGGHDGLKLLEPG